MVMSLLPEMTIFDIRLTTKNFYLVETKIWHLHKMRQTKILSKSNNFEESCYFTWYCIVTCFTSIMSCVKLL